MVFSGSLQQQKRGSDSEKMFESICFSKNIFIKKSSTYENTRKHIDFYIRLKKNTKSVDVKAIKRYKGQFQDKYYYIEFINDWGNKGWIYSKSMDLVAFECFDCFRIYKRKKILDFINNNPNKFEITTRTLFNSKKTSKCIMVDRNVIESLLYYKLDKNNYMFVNC